MHHFNGVIEIIFEKQQRIVKQSKITYKNFFFVLEIFIDNTLVAQQAEIICSAGQSVQFGVRISNLSPVALHQLTVTIAFYQDYQNGIHNFKLETRVIMSGPDR